MELENSEQNDDPWRVNLLFSPKDKEIIETLALLEQTNTSDILREALRIGVWYQKEIWVNAHTDEGLDEIPDLYNIAPEEPKPMVVNLSEYLPSLEVAIAIPLRTRVWNLLGNKST